MPGYSALFWVIARRNYRVRDSCDETLGCLRCQVMKFHRPWAKWAHKVDSLSIGVGNKSCKARRLGKSKPVKYWEIIADRLHAEGCSNGIAEHFTKHRFLFLRRCTPRRKTIHRQGRWFVDGVSFAGERRDSTKSR